MMSTTRQEICGSYRRAMLETGLPQSQELRVGVNIGNEGRLSGIDCLAFYL